MTQKGEGTKGGRKVGEKGVAGGNWKETSGSAQRKSQGHGDQERFNDFSLRSHGPPHPPTEILSAFSQLCSLQLLVSAAAAANSLGTAAPARPGLLLFIRLDTDAVFRNRPLQASGFQSPSRL